MEGGRKYVVEFTEGQYEVTDDVFKIKAKGTTCVFRAISKRGAQTRDKWQYIVFSVCVQHRLVTEQYQCTRIRTTRRHTRIGEKRRDIGKLKYRESYQRRGEGATLIRTADREESAHTKEIE